MRASLSAKGERCSPFLLNKAPTYNKLAFFCFVKIANCSRFLEETKRSVNGGICPAGSDERCSSMSFPFLVKDATHQSQVLGNKISLTPFNFKSENILCRHADVEPDGLQGWANPKHIPSSFLSVSSSSAFNSRIIGFISSLAASRGRLLSQPHIFP